MERNWEKEIGMKEGKKTAKIRFFRLLKEITLWDRYQIKKQGIYFKPQTANNVAANSKLHNLQDKQL